METRTHRRNSPLLFFTGVFLVIVFLSTSQAQVPDVLSYSGYLTNAGGNPINGVRDLTFALYASSTGGTPLWLESHQNVHLSAGVFHVVLGRGTVPQPLTISFDQQYYLGITIGNSAELTPRQELMPSAYSLRARTAEEVDDTSITSEKLRANSVTDEKIQSVSWSKLTGLNEGVSSRVWSLQGNRFSNPNEEFLGTTDEVDLVFRTNNLQRMVLHSEGNVGIGTMAPSVKLHVQTGLNQHGFAHTDGTHNLLTWLGTSEGIEGAWIGPSFPHALSLQTSNSARLTISAAGNVGIATVNPSERLHVVGNTRLGGNLNTNGNAEFLGDLEVGGLTTLNDATVLGDLNAAGDFIVSGDGNFANLNVFNDATVGHDLTVTRKLDVSQLEVVGDVSGPPGATENYVAVFENTGTGSQTNGLAVKLRRQGNSKPNSSNNFITFFNGANNEVSGRIEGQTQNEVLNHPLNLVDIGSNSFQIGFAIGMAWIDPGNVVQEIAEKAAWGIRFGASVANAGVSYESGNGDYAEWLPRLYENEKLEPGDVVGVFSGRISRSTGGAERIMVVSSNPIVLGNMPEKTREYLFEKVAFLGQVPVKIVGVVEEGDYIVSSGRGDGCAVAISPKLMTSDEFAKVVGRAWGSSKVPYRKLVNVAVGMNMGGDVAPIVKRVENNVRDLRARLEEGTKLLARAQTRLEELESKVGVWNVQHEEIDQLKEAVTALQQAVQAGGSSPADGSDALAAVRKK